MKLRVAVLASQSILFTFSVTAQVAPVAQQKEFMALPGQPFKVSLGKHTARGGAESLSAEIAQESALNETRTIPIPTRTSFVANWSSVPGATGYRLDVSTSSSFRSVVSGYQDLDAGNMTSRVVSGLRPGTTYYYRVRAYNAVGISGNSEVITATTQSGAGLTINATFDSSIINNPNAAAIESMINQAIATFESLFSDPISVSILFRYSSTAPNGTPLDSGVLAKSFIVLYQLPWDS